MIKIDLAEKRELIQNLGKELFDRITKIPIEIRPDDKQRTGIQIVARELKTRNIVMESIYKPSEAARFFAVEKTVRTECYMETTSQQSEYPGFMKFAGSVSYYSEDYGQEFHVSVSGLKAEEDVLVSIIILSRLIEKTVDEVINRIKVMVEYDKKRGRYLPWELFDEGNYINTVLKEYK